MKKKLVFVLFSAIIFAFSTSALADWELYDDFSSGEISNERWSDYSPGATISVENEQAKFVHQSGHPSVLNVLAFNQTPENIIGIKADVLIESCTGDVRVRIDGHSAKMGEYHVWLGLQLQPSMERIYTLADLNGPPPDYIWVQDLHYAQYERPITVTGITFNLTMVFSNDKITYEVDGLGKITYKYATAVAPTGGTYKALGTRSTHGEGPCTVYFDNVYVLRP